MRKSCALHVFFLLRCVPTAASKPYKTSQEVSLTSSCSLGSFFCSCFFFLFLAHASCPLLLCSATMSSGDLVHAAGEHDADENSNEIIETFVHE